jgi:hypothetical protein
MSNPAFGNSAGALREYVLSEAGFGLPKENLLDLFDSPAGPSAQDDEIARFLTGRMTELKQSRSPPTDLILYYVGHGGFFPPHDQYFLALGCTKEGNESISGYPIHSLAVTLREAASWLRRYLILDCCFSAAAYQAFQSSGPMEVARIKTEEHLPTKGTALLCASSPRDPAKAPRDQDYTMFSGVLLDILRKGCPDLPERMSLAQVGKSAELLIRKRFADMAVRPEVHSPDQKKGDVGEIALFPNHGLVPEEPRIRASLWRSLIRKLRTMIPPWLVVVALVAGLVSAAIAIGYATGILQGEEDLVTRVRRSVQPKARKDPEVMGRNAKGQPLYNNWFWIEAPPEIMNQIKKVIYQCPDTSYTGTERTQGFIAGYLGVGPWRREYDIHITLVLRGGEKVSMKFNMHEAVYGR